MTPPRRRTSTSSGVVSAEEYFVGTVLRIPGASDWPVSGAGREGRELRVTPVRNGYLPARIQLGWYPLYRSSRPGRSDGCVTIG